DREAAGRLLPPRGLAAQAADLARGGRGGLAAREHGQPGDLEQVPALQARDVRAEVLLHQRRRLGRRGGRGFGRSGQGADPRAVRCRGSERHPVGRPARRAPAPEGLRPRAPDGGEIPRGDRDRLLDPAPPPEETRPGGMTRAPAPGKKGKLPYALLPKRLGANAQSLKGKLTFFV